MIHRRNLCLVALSALLVWMQEDPRPKPLWERPVAGANMLVQSGDGRTLAVGTRQGRVELSDADSGKLLATVAHSFGLVHKLKLSRNGRVGLSLAVDDSGPELKVELLTWDAPTGANRRAWPYSPWLLAAELSPDGRYLAVSDLPGAAPHDRSVVVLFDRATGRRVAAREFPEEGGLTLAFSPDGKHLAVGMSWGERKRERGAAILTVPELKPLRRLESGCGVFGVTYANDGRLAVEGWRPVERTGEGFYRVWIRCAESLSARR